MTTREHDILESYLKTIATLPRKTKADLITQKANGMGLSQADINRFLYQFDLD